MKRVFTSFCAVVLLSLVSFTSKASTYYVISGQEFKLSPQAGSTFVQYIWTINPGTGQLLSTLDEASGGVLTHTFGTGNETTATVHKVTLGVLQQLQGCLSEVVEHTIIVLPKVTVTLTADKTSFCENLAVNANLTAKVSVTAGLEELGVTLSPLAWKKGTTDVPAGTDPSILHVTTPGNYSAFVSYILPTVGNYIPTASKLAESVVPGVVEILNNLPIPTAPIITLN